MQRDGYLDALRGLAALLVLLAHGMENFGAELPFGWFGAFVGRSLEALHLGRVGVVVFFALSGFLIARSLGRDDWKRSFPVKRLLRLYPIYLFSVLVVAVGIEPELQWARLAANLSMLPTLWGEAEYMGLYWTLQMEVLFYVAFYLLAWMGLARSTRALFWISGASTLFYMGIEVWAPQEFLSSLPLVLEKLPQHLGIMFWGAYLSRIGPERFFCGEALGLTGLLLLPPLVAGAEYLLGGSSGSAPVMLAYLWAVLGSLAALRARWSWRPMEALGRISYSLYLNHGLVLWYLASQGEALDPWTAMALYLGITLGLSLVTFRCIEQPALDWARNCFRVPRPKL